VFGIFATLAEFERDLIKERTMAGLAAARAPRSSPSTRDLDMPASKPAFANDAAPGAARSVVSLLYQKHAPELGEPADSEPKSPSPCRARPLQILNQRSSTRLLLGQDAGPECQIADCAGGVVKPDAISVEASLDGRLVDAERGVEHVLAADIKKQIAKIVVPIRPSGAAVVEDAVDCIGLIERQVVRAQVAVDKGPIGRIHRHALVFFDNVCERADQTAVVDDARQAFANPGAGSGHGTCCRSQPAASYKNDPVLLGWIRDAQRDSVSNPVAYLEAVIKQHAKQSEFGAGYRPNGDAWSLCRRTPYPMVVNLDNVYRHVLTLPVSICELGVCADTKVNGPNAP
jgi:hypothetical protein